MAPKTPAKSTTAASKTLAKKATAKKAAPKKASPAKPAAKPTPKKAAPEKPADKPTPKKASPDKPTPKKASPPKPATTPSAAKPPKAPKLLSGGNPQIAKGDGDGPVQDYIAAIPGWRQDIGRRLDALVARNVPEVHKGIRWNSPFYGIQGKGWFMGVHVFTNYLKVTFFKGTSLVPAPPGGVSKEARWIDVHQADLDEAQMSAWIRQAAALPGWGKI